MSTDQIAANTIISRLTRKIDILESMIEDHSSKAYHESQRRSAINALLELSLRAKKVDVFLSQVFDPIFSANPLSIEEKGAIFLFDEGKDELTLYAHSNLSKSHVSSIKHLQITQDFYEQVLSKGSIFHSSKFDNTFAHLPDIEPHGHYYVPISSGNKNYGLIILFTAYEIQKNHEDVNFFSTIADICAGTLERLYYSKQILTYQQNLERQIEEQTQNLVKEKELLAVTLRSIGDGVITTDLDGKIVLINKVTEQLTGWQQQDAIGRPVQEIFNTIGEKTGSTCNNHPDKLVVSEKIVDLPNYTTLIAQDGTRHMIEESGAPIFDKESKIIGTVIVFRDVTTVIKTEKELLKIEKLDSVGVLAGGIAHDFNNILVGILGNIELAGMCLDSSSKAFSLLQGAKKAAVRAKDLTQQLLTFSKGGDPVKKTTSIGAVISESTNFVLRGSSVTCQLRIADDLWLVNIDSGQISQVIQNLTINAKHAMPDGGEVLIECSNVTNIKSELAVALSTKEYIKITVQDSGCGMSEKQLKKIFDPYFTTKQEGSGLGLAITHSIINKHNGHISVHSKIGKGTTFTIYLPSSNKNLSKTPSKRDQKARTFNAKILVMDDDPIVQEITQDMLVLLGNEVLLAANGYEAIKIFSEQHNNATPIDVIIMDLTIQGGMGGKTAIEEILKIDHAAKVIVSSGYSTDPIMSNYQQYGFVAALPKPFLLDELSKTLTDILS